MLVTKWRVFFNFLKVKFSLCFHIPQNLISENFNNPPPSLRDQDSNKCFIQRNYTFFIATLHELAHETELWPLRDGAKQFSWTIFLFFFLLPEPER